MLMPCTPFTSRKNRGVMLIMVLWIITLLSLIMYSLLYSLTMDTRISSVRKKSLIADGIARAGLAKGFADLRNDMIIDFSEDEDPPFDAEGDYWASPDEEKIDIEFGEGIYNVEVTDLDRYLNLNMSSATNKILLEKVIESIGYNEEDAKIVASAIVDYADNNEKSSLDSSNADEGIAYGLLMAEDNGENADEDDVTRMIFPNEPYLTVESLLDVYGVTPELYFGPGTEEAEHYRKIMDLPDANTIDRFQMEDRRRSRIGDQKILGLRDYFNVRDGVELNVNTAPVHVLAALLEAAGALNSESAAEGIVSDRRGGKSRRINNDDAFKIIQDFQSSDRLGSVAGTLQSLHPFGVRSSEFNVRSVGTYNGVSKTLDVRVSRVFGSFQRDEDLDSLARSSEHRKRYEDRSKRWESEDDELLVRIPIVRMIRWNEY